MSSEVGILYKKSNNDIREGSYNLTKAKMKTKIVFIVTVWIIAAIVIFLGSLLIIFANIIVNMFDWSTEVLALGENEDVDTLFSGEGTPLVISALIGGSLAIVFALVIICFRRMNIFAGGRHILFFMVKVLRGKFGDILSLFPFIEFRGEWFLEENFKNRMDFSNTTQILRELFIERWYDTLVFPTALAAVFGHLIIILLPKLEYRTINLIPLLTPTLVLLVLMIYFPLIWALDEGGFKMVITSREGDIIRVKHLSSSIKGAFGTIVGIGGVISLGDVASGLALTANIPQRDEIIDNILGLSIISLSNAILWTLGLFLVLLSSILLGVGIVALNYLENYHLSTIKYLRHRSAENKVIIRFGSLNRSFSSHHTDPIYMVNDTELL
ncbi:MAG: hypothetical protein ACXADY_25330 [Candidatus Hodarchaeales archaeon]|jgi:hypothetical protein